MKLEVKRAVCELTVKCACRSYAPLKDGVIGPTQVGPLPDCRLCGGKGREPRFPMLQLDCPARSYEKEYSRRPSMCSAECPSRLSSSECLGYIPSDRLEDWAKALPQGSLIVKAKNKWEVTPPGIFAGMGLVAGLSEDLIEAIARALLAACIWEAAFNRELDWEWVKPVVAALTAIATSREDCLSDYAKFCESTAREALAQLGGVKARRQSFAASLKASRYQGEPR